MKVYNRSLIVVNKTFIKESKSLNIFHKYVIREHVAPFIFAFSIIMFVLVLKLMLQLMEMLISKGVGITVMAKLLVYNLAWMVALVVPMSVLVASLMAFGRMGSSGEITAIKAAGISMYRLVSPIILLSILLTIIMIWFNNVILPEANHRAHTLRTAIGIKKPELSIKNREGQFISDLPGITIRVKEFDYETKEMRGVTLFKQEKHNYTTTIIAEKGEFKTYPEGDRLALILGNGEIHRTNFEQNQYIRNKFDTFTQLVKVDFGLNISRQVLKNDRTKTTAEMRKDIKNSEARIEEYTHKIDMIPHNRTNREAEIKRYTYLIENERQNINAYLVEIHKKNSIPFAAIVFVLIGSSLGILVKRSGASIGIGLSIGFFMLYYLFLIGGESAGDRMLLAPWITMWLPNFVFGALGIAFIVYANRR